MAVAAALASSLTPREKLPLRRDSSSSVDSDDSSTASETPISYATDPNRPKGEPTPRTTKQKVDRRPPSTFVSILPVSAVSEVVTPECSLRRGALHSTSSLAPR